MSEIYELQEEGAFPKLIVKSRATNKRIASFLKEKMDFEKFSVDNNASGYTKPDGTIYFTYNFRDDLVNDFLEVQEDLKHFLSGLDEKLLLRMDVHKQSETPGVDDKIKQEVAVLIASRQEDDASEILVKYILKKEHIKTTRNDLKSQTWFYCEGIYIPNGETKIQEILRGILDKLYTTQRCNKVLDKIQADTGVDEDLFFNDNYVDEIPVLNGILHLKTRELEKFTPDKVFFNKLPVVYDPNKTCHSIDKFLKEILATSEDAKVMYEVIGYCLYKEHFVEKAFMFVGDGRNGKGKLLSMLKHFLGAFNCCSVALSQMTHQNTGICEMFGKLANLSGDLSPTALKETGLFKEITGRDLLSAKRKYLTDLTFVNYSKQFFACNQLPRVYDMSLGFWSRWMLFEFPFTFVKQDEYDSSDNKTNMKLRDEQIITKITTEDELSGLLNKALDGFDRIIKKGDFTTTKGTKEVKETWIRKADSFLAFCLDNIEEEYDSYIPKKEVRRKFYQYVKQHKLKGCSDIVIKRNLEDNFGAFEERKSILIEEREWCWSGIKWKE